jgi:hypothetical protein
MKKNLAVFLIVFSLFASAGIALEPAITPFFRELFNSVSALSPKTEPPPLPPVSLGSGDANNDGATDFLDLWAAAYGWNLNDPMLDQYRDGKVNALDAAVIMETMK